MSAHWILPTVHDRHSQDNFLPMMVTKPSEVMANNGRSAIEVWGSCQAISLTKNRPPMARTIGGQTALTSNRQPSALPSSPLEVSMCCWRPPKRKKYARLSPFLSMNMTSKSSQVQRGGTFGASITSCVQKFRNTVAGDEVLKEK